MWKASSLADRLNHQVQVSESKEQRSRKATKKPVRFKGLNQTTVAGEDFAAKDVGKDVDVGDQRR